MEILKARSAQTDVLQTLRNHKCQPRLLYPAKHSVMMGENERYSAIKLYLNCVYLQIQLLYFSIEGTKKEHSIKKTQGITNLRAKKKSNGVGVLTSQ